jgi:hypothetical protein
MDFNRTIQIALSGLYIDVHLMRWSGVSNFLKRFNQRESCENERQSGRPRKTDDRGDRKMLRCVKTDRRQSLKEIKARLFESTTTCVSSLNITLFQSLFKVHLSFDLHQCTLWCLFSVRMVRVLRWFLIYHIVTLIYSEIMKRKFKQWWSSILPISTKRTLTFLTELQKYKE